MPNVPKPPDARPASPPVPQSWCSVLPITESGSPEGEPVAQPAAAAPIPVDGLGGMGRLGWKAPKPTPRVRNVPVFGRNASADNTSHAETADGNPVPGGAVRDFPQEPTANDEQVHQLRQHIVPDPMPPDELEPGSAEALVREDLQQALGRVHLGNVDGLVATIGEDRALVMLAAAPAPSAAPGLQLENIEVRWEGDAFVAVARVAGTESACNALLRQQASGILATHGLPSGASHDDDIVRELRATPPDDPDFQEVATDSGRTVQDCVARFQDAVRFATAEPDNPRKGAEAAQAPDDAVPVDRDAATPNDGGVPQDAPKVVDLGSADLGSAYQFSCALWSDGEFTICPSDGEPLVLNRSDTREMLRYVSEALSARARAAA